MSKKQLSGATALERLELARSVRDLRQAAGLKQDELAELAGVTRQTVSNMERGMTPQEDSLRKVLTVLGVETEEGEFEAQTEIWLTMMGTLIETIPSGGRPPVVDAAIRVIAAGVRQSREDVAGTDDDYDFQTRPDRKSDYAPAAKKGVRKIDR